MSRLMGLPDPRSIGSGNPGATNVLRSGSRLAAALVLLADALKGIPAIIFAIAQSFPPVWLYLVAAAVLLGHMYPIFLRFKGGKGVATTLGILGALHWPIAAVWAAIWLLTAKGLGYSSLAALIATASLAPVALWMQQPTEFVIFLLALTIMIFWRHRQNIIKLVQHKESKIGS